MKDSIGIAKIFRSIQGEGLLAGVPMVFVRTAGCSVGCLGCDTNYKLYRKMTIKEISSQALSMQKGGWVWITGGEPTDWPQIGDLRDAMRQDGFRVAIATSGIRSVDGYDFVSVSPHTRDFAQKSGDQINIVPGLNGFKLIWADEIGAWARNNFRAMFITPMEGASPLECIKFVLENSHWRLGNQSHKNWRVE